MALPALLYAMLNCHSNFFDLSGLFFSLLMCVCVLLVLHSFSADRTILVWVPGIIWAFVRTFSVLVFYSMRKSVVEVQEIAEHKMTSTQTPSTEENDKATSTDITKVTKNSSTFKQQIKKKKKKQSKTRKSKYKNMDEKNTSSIITQKTKIYQPLSLYVQMNLKPHELYFHLIRYAMKSEQLVQNGFPLDSPKRPRCLSDDSHFKDDSSNLFERSCCRCGDKFFVSPEGEYESSTYCQYHRGKIPSYKGPYSGLYTCCKGDHLSEGCALNKFHVSAQGFSNDVEFKKTQVKKHANWQQACNIYALDCEMCYTTGGFEVVKVGLVGPDGLTIYDSYVLPEHRVLDYNTAYSGVTANHLRGVTTTLADVQAFLVKQFNKNTILVGHALENDLKVLRLIHETIVDTSIVFPHKYGGRYKRSLKSLAADYLQKTIQSGNKGHDCIEDSRTCMELMLWKIQSEFSSNETNSSVQNMVSQCPQMVLPNDRNNQVASNQHNSCYQLSPSGNECNVNNQYMDIEPGTWQWKPSQLQQMPVPIKKYDVSIHTNNQLAMNDMINQIATHIVPAIIIGEINAYACYSYPSNHKYQCPPDCKFILKHAQERFRQWDPVKDLMQCMGHLSDGDESMHTDEDSL